MTPYYDHAGVTIYHGDSAALLPTLGRFDLVLTDPPYGVDVDTSNASRKRGHRHDPSIAAVDFPRVRGDAGPFDPSSLLAAADAHVLWGANNYASRLPDSSCWLAWDRKDRRNDGSDVTDVELAWVGGLRFKTVRIFRHLWAGFLRDSEIGERVLHPTQKPVALMRWCLSFFPKARTVLDPYMGSGPVALACKEMGLKYVGIELEERYCQSAVTRLAQEQLFALGGGE